MNHRDTAIAILEVLQKRRRIRKSNVDEYAIEPFIEMVEPYIKKNEPFKMLLPAFHCKSINPDSVLGTTPDGAEEEAIKNLTEICEEIQAIYQPGCELLVVHEGHFYSDIEITPSDEVIEKYEKCIDEMTHCSMIHYSNIMLDYFGNSYEEARKKIFNKYMKRLPDVRLLTLEDEAVKQKFLAYKTFITHEFAPIIMRGYSKQEIRNYSRIIAYQWVQRYLVFKSICKDLFGDYFRLSVLAYPSKSKSFGINLVINTSEYGLPWFHVLLKKKNGSMELIKKSKAEKLGYRLIFKNNRPWYYTDELEK